MGFGMAVDPWLLKWWDLLGSVPHSTQQALVTYHQRIGCIKLYQVIYTVSVIKSYMFILEFMVSISRCISYQIIRLDFLKYCLSSCRFTNYTYIILVGGLEHFFFSHILLTFIFFRGVAQPPTGIYQTVVDWKTRKSPFHGSRPASHHLPPFHRWIGTQPWQTLRSPSVVRRRLIYVVNFTGKPWEVPT